MADPAIDVQGLKETQQKMEQVIRDLHGDEMVQGMKTATMLVERDAKILAPVDTGRLRASITPEVTIEGTTVQGVVGTVLEYGAAMETGTGTPAGNAPHYPPPDALDTWAQRHGFSSGMQVARIIWRRGGLVGRHYLQRAFDQNEDQIQDLIDGVVGKIVNK